MLDNTVSKSVKYSQNLWRNVRTERATDLAFYFLTPFSTKIFNSTIADQRHHWIPRNCTLSSCPLSEWHLPVVQARSPRHFYITHCHTPHSLQLSSPVNPTFIKFLIHIHPPPIPIAISKVKTRVGSILKLIDQLLMELQFHETCFVKRCSYSFQLKLGDEWYKVENDLYV